MSFLGKTALEKWSTCIIAMLSVVIFSAIFKWFGISAVGGIMLVGVLPFWFRALSEELVISFLKRSHGSCRNDELIEEYSEKMIAVVSRLERKAIVKIEREHISLINKDHICAFDTCRS